MFVTGETVARVRTFCIIFSMFSIHLKLFPKKLYSESRMVVARGWGEVGMVVFHTVCWMVCGSHFGLAAWWDLAFPGNHTSSYDLCEELW